MLIRRSTGIIMRPINLISLPNMVTGNTMRITQDLIRMNLRIWPKKHEILVSCAGTVKNDWRSRHSISRRRTTVIERGIRLEMPTGWCLITIVAMQITWKLRGFAIFSVFLSLPTISIGVRPDRIWKRMLILANRWSISPISGPMKIIQLQKYIAMPKKLSCF